MQNCCSISFFLYGLYFSFLNGQLIDHLLPWFYRTEEELSTSKTAQPESATKSSRWEHILFSAELSADILYCLLGWKTLEKVKYQKTDDKKLV